MDQSTAIPLPAELITREPEITAQTAQIANPTEALFKRLDTPESGLINKDELDSMRQLSERIDAAKKFIPFLYTYRSIQKALTRCDAIKNLNNDGDKERSQKFTDLFRQFFEPRVLILIDIMDSCKSAVSILSKIILNQNYEPSEALFTKMMEMLDILYNIDAIKSLKVGINIDVSSFKRDKELKSQKYEHINEKLNYLQPFMATPNITLSDLKREITKEKGGAERSLHFVNSFLGFIVNSYRHDVITPTRHAQIITSVVSLLFIQGSKNPSENIFNQTVTREVMQILSENPIGILYGENSFLPGDLFRRMEGYQTYKGIFVPTSANELRPLEDQFLVKNQIKEFRVMYRECLASTTKIQRTGEVTIETLNNLLTCLSKMCLSVQLQSKFKFICMASLNTGFKYDLAVKLNYTSEDLNALIEIIGYIKTIASVAISSESTIVAYVANYVDIKVQEFVVNTIERPLVRALAADDKDSVSLLSQIRNVFGRWRNADPLSNLPDTTKKIIPHKVVPSGSQISMRQLDVLRAQMESIIRPDSAFRKKVALFTRSHFRPKHVNQTIEFLTESRMWPDLLNYVSVVRETSNLGSLWFRELFIDMDGVVQYPVRSSLPFILAEHLLKLSDQPSLHDSFFFPFEIYNDAAALALGVFDSQYLYKEIEAEVSLCIDMITFQFADTYYRICRTTAATMELPPECIGKVTAMPMRYSVVVKQNKIELLGSAVDFNLITTGKLNARLKSELESIMSIMSDIRFLPYAVHLFKVCQTTHALLSETLLLDDFNQIWERAAGKDLPLVLESAVLLKIVNSIDFSKMRFNAVSMRFTSTREGTIVPISNEPWSSVYAEIHQNETRFIGGVHVSAILKILSPGELAVFVKHCIQVLEMRTLQAVESYAKVAASVRLLPAISKDDLVGFYAFNSDAYSSLSSEISSSRLFDNLRVVGNILGFLWILECEVEGFVGSALETLKRVLRENEELFVSAGGLDLESTITHRSFASVWSVLEFVHCSREGERVSSLEGYGDGVAIAAHVMICLCGQSELYKFDSVTFRTLELHNAERAKIGSEELKVFAAAAAIADQARKFAEVMAGPYSEF